MLDLLYILSLYIVLQTQLSLTIYMIIYIELALSVKIFITVISFVQSGRLT